MSNATPRMRMFAGPNGSGKSSLKSYLRQDLLGIYLNPDDIETDIRNRGWLDLSTFGVEVLGDEILSFFQSSLLLHGSGLQQEAGKLRFSQQKLFFSDVEVNAYFASALVDFLRTKLLEKWVTFTFETVMSHEGKVGLLRQAQSRGYRTYLYYVATEDPEINISRVRNRIELGGHAVPEERIVKRYYRSLELLREAIRYANRAYILIIPPIMQTGDTPGLRK